MPIFKGFSEGKARSTSLPGVFFTELLPEVDHLGELKVVLYALWRVDRQEGSFRYLLRSDFASDAILMQGLGKSPREAELTLDESLERAVVRGALLKATIQPGAHSQDYYFLNSPKGQAAVKAIQQGKWRPTGDERMPVELSMERPNIFRLYEQHIGPLTPMIADTLRDAEAAYPIDWIEDAIRIAVEKNVRNWRYIQAILKRWLEKGRDEREDRRDTEEARRRYSEWEDTTR